MSKTQVLKSKTITLRVPEEVKEYFEELAEYDNQSLNEVAKRTLERGIKIDQIIDYIEDLRKNGGDIKEITVEDILEYVNPELEKPKRFLHKGEVKQKKAKSLFQRIFGSA